VHPAGEPLTVQREPPTWTTRDTALPGSALMAVGLPMPVLAPENALLLHLRAR
jgi:alpha-galactosidase